MTARTLACCAALATVVAAFRAPAAPLLRPRPRLAPLAASYAIGVDVGTGSARAGLVDVATGQLVSVAKRDIVMFEPKLDHFEQSSDDIWASVCACVKEALAEGGAAASDVVGVGFDATCSLVSLDRDDRPVGVDPTCPTDDARNVVVWLDHRANGQAARINAGGHKALRTVGGTISPEMEVPKMLWLKEEMPDAFGRVLDGGKFLDLPDFLTYKATGGNHARSLCTVVCKWNYDAAKDGSGVGWDRSFLESVGFDAGELTPDQIGEEVLAPGAPLKGGVGAQAAVDLGLAEGTPVAVGMIDAHAGGVGSLGATVPGAASAPDQESRLALIAGTSTCHMASSGEACFVPGVWGPYYSAMFEGLYLNEAGQSAAGKLLDHLVETHAAFPEVEALAKAAGGIPPTIALNRHLEAMAKAAGVPVALLAHDLHVTPDAIGNRAPLADPLMRAGVVGLSLSATLDDCARLYLAATQALAYQTRHIVDSMAAAGHPAIESVFACGGLAKNGLYSGTHADVLGLALHLPQEDEAVLLGSAILGATAGGAHPSVGAAMAAMTAVGDSVAPSTSAAVATYHDRKYQIFLKMSQDQIGYRAMMTGSGSGAEE